TRMIAVIIPELVGSHWYEYLLHNQRSTAMKAALLLRGDQQVVVINVPWYLSGRRVSAEPGAQGVTHGKGQRDGANLAD
ncbi:MAG: hypothetical protein JO250_16620, partial [Armatimonadetes bacterium]|nr:hypothetical protein [Armatimonadota bacterium]